MRLKLPAFLLLAPGLIHAAEPVIPPLEPSIPAISLLPVGSVLKNVMLPRYDKLRKLAGVLKVEHMTLVSADQISGKTVSLELFNPDRSPRGRLDLTEALFDQKKGMLQARQPVTIDSDRVSASGTGLIYAFDQGKGFLIGPGKTTIKNPPATAMNSSSPALRATTIFGAALLPLIAAPPVAITPEQSAAIQQETGSKTSEAETAMKTVRTGLRASLAASEEATKNLTAFLDQADLPDAGGEPDFIPNSQPAENKVGPEDTLIDFRGGMYLDNEEAVVVFLKGVTVQDARYDLKGANELKVFFEKKEAAPKDRTKKAAKPKPDEVDLKKAVEPPQNLPAGDPVASPEKPGDDKPAERKKLPKNSLNMGGNGLGDPKRIYASGAVRVTQKAAAGKKPVEASGAVFNYDLVTGDIVITGGFPWVISEATGYIKAQEFNAIIRVNQNGEVSTQGHFILGGKLNQKK